jgi:pilus assembly protein CpaB
MNRRMLGVIAAVALGAIGTFVLVAYVRDAEDRAVAGEKMVNVVVATADVPANTASEDLTSVAKTQQVPAKVRADGAITSLSDVKGKVTATDLVPGEVLLADRFATPGAVTQGVGEVKVPRGDTEITLSLEPQRAVGGLIKPGDRVMVVGTPGASPTDAAIPAGVLAHQVLVTNVQIEDKTGEPSRDQTKTVAPTQDLLITLAVDDATATKILAFAAEGNVWLGAEQQELSGSTSS